MHWDESNKIPLDYVIIYRLKIKYKLKINCEYWIVSKKIKWDEVTETKVIYYKKKYYYQLQV